MFKMRLSLLFLVFFGFAMPSAKADYRILGILGGFNFPKMFVGKLDVNLGEYAGIDIQESVGVYWSIQQADVVYYFSRGEWSPYIAAGIQNWNFYGISASTNYNGVIFGSGNSAVALSAPLGLQYVADNGFALDLTIAVDVFTNAPADLSGKVIPEAGLMMGYFF